MNPVENEQLAKLRATIKTDKNPPQLIDSVLRQRFAPIERANLGRFRRKVLMTTSLKEFRDGFIKHEGYTPSIPMLCSHYLMSEVCRATREESFNLAGIEDYTGMVLWYDIGDGVIMSINQIKFAENEIRGDTERYVAGSVEAYEPSVVKAAELYVVAAPYLQNEARLLGNLLKDDPTGFAILDKTVANLRAEAKGEQVDLHFLAPFHVPQFVIAGAEFARKLYRTIYPIAAQLPKQSL